MSPLVRAVLLAWLAIIASVAQADDDEVSAAASPPVTDSASTPSTPQSPRVTPPGEERYIGIVGGRGTVADASVSATHQCILCAPVSADRMVHFSPAGVATLRAGVWGGGNLLHLGMAVELADNPVSADEGAAGKVDLHYTTLAVVPMVRLPLFSGTAMPGGHVNLYGGIAIPLMVTGDMSVSFPELPRTVSGQVKGHGVAALFGVSLKYAHVSLQAEFRDDSMHLTFSDIGDSGAVTVRSRQTLLGLAWLF